MTVQDRIRRLFTPDAVARSEAFVRRHRWRFVAGIIILNGIQIVYQGATVWPINLYLTGVTLCVVLLGMKAAPTLGVRCVFSVALVMQVSAALAGHLYLPEKALRHLGFGDDLPLPKTAPIQFHNEIVPMFFEPPVTGFWLEMEFASLDDEFRSHLESVLAGRMDLSLEVIRLLQHRPCDVRVNEALPIRVQSSGKVRFSGRFNWPVYVGEGEIRRLLRTGRMTFHADCAGSAPIDRLYFRSFPGHEIAGRRDFVTANGKRRPVMSADGKHRLAFIKFEFRDKKGLLRHLWF